MAPKTVIPALAAAGEFTGRELGPSEWTTVDQARIDAFAAVTGDRQWIHCDVARARSDSPWGSTLTHRVPRCLANVKDR